MANQDEARWEQRHNNFKKAMRQLDAACQKSAYTELERAGLVQIFEFTFELCWKTLKDRLNHEGLTVMTPRETLRKAFEVGYLSQSEAEILLDALEKRKLLSHTYEESVVIEAEQLINNKYAPVLLTVSIRLDQKRT